MATIGYSPPQPVHAASYQQIPALTDDSLDPINLIWTGYAPAWWVAANLYGWSDTAYCSSPKTVVGLEYNYTLELPDSGAPPCIGPRDHVRIWNMGYSPTLGWWSIGAAHHEQTVCFPCHHVIDSWERAESDVRSTFALGQYTMSISNYSLPNAGLYQNIYNDGNATLIQMKPPPPREYPVVFDENGLGNGTSWSITLNGETRSSQLPDIVFSKSNGTFSFTTNPIPGYVSTPMAGSITVLGAETRQTINFQVPWATYSAIIYPNSQQPIHVGFNGNATVNTSTVHFTGANTPHLGFNATEIGPRGMLDVTVPRSITSSRASVLVTIDGVDDPGAMVSSDVNNYYVSFIFPYGNHSIDLAFNSSPLPYFWYTAIGALSAGTVGTIILVRNRRKRTHFMH